MKGATGWKLLAQKFVRDRSALAGLVILIGLIFTAALAPYLAPFPEDVPATHPAQRLRPPSWEHPLGTNTLGRDIYSRILYGGRITLVISVTVVAACIVELYRLYLGGGRPGRACQRGLFQHPSATDPTLWPSDHAGVWADLSFV